nr:MAPEG family protein [Thioalkalivibrio sp. XN8]
MLALLFVALSVRTLRLRRRYKLALGDGGNPLMLRAIRTHANFAEYAPLGLLLLAGAEISGSPALLTHAIGLMLLAGRVLHAFGVSREAEVFAFRVSGMALTFTAYLVAAAYILFRSAAGGA